MPAHISNLRSIVTKVSLVILITVIASLVFMLRFTTTASLGQWGRENEHLIYMGKLLRNYAAIHEGSLPNNLSDLSDKIEKDKSAARQFYDQRNGLTYDWLYYPIKLGADRREIILATPISLTYSPSTTRFRFVIYSDFTDGKIMEEVFRQQIMLQEQRKM